MHKKYKNLTGTSDPKIDFQQNFERIIEQSSQITTAQYEN